MTNNPLQHRLSPASMVSPQVKSPLRQLYRWRMGSACRWRVLPEPDAGDRAATVRSGVFGKRDIDLALDAAHKVKDKWAHTSVQDRAAILFKIADRMEQNLELLATAETRDNGKPIRETSAADVPLAIDHFRYFASCIRAQEGGISEIDSETVAYHFHEPLGVVGQIIPWNFPLLMASWKMAPALAAGNCVVLKPARLTPLSVLLLMEIVGDLLPPGGERGQWRRWGNWRISGDLETHRQSGVYWLNGSGPTNYAIRHAKHYSGDAGAGRQIAKYLLC